MARTIFVAAAVSILLVILLLAGCDKEKIIQSTEYVHDIKYIELPPDTVVRVDTLDGRDTVLVRVTDTVRVTVTVHDTVVSVRNHYDTVHVTDTVLKTQCPPNAPLAVAAMEAQTDPMVLDFVSQEIGMNEGWIYYLSPDQMEITRVSSNVYDIYAYVDFWAPDWSGYYPIEVYWRLTYQSGDPADPDNWQMSDPPSAPSGHSSGIRAVHRTQPLLMQR